MAPNGLPRSWSCRTAAQLRHREGAQDRFRSLFHRITELGFPGRTIPCRPRRRRPHRALPEDQQNQKVTPISPRQHNQAPRPQFPHLLPHAPHSRLLHRRARLRRHHLLLIEMVRLPHLPARSDAGLCERAEGAVDA